MNHYSSFVGAAPVLISKDSLEVHFALFFSDFLGPWIVRGQILTSHAPHLRQPCFRNLGLCLVA